MLAKAVETYQGQLFEAEDPFDRMIIATAYKLIRLALMSVDLSHFINYPELLKDSLLNN